jgi:hypothetical protein
MAKPDMEIIVAAPKKMGFIMAVVIVAILAFVVGTGFTLGVNYAAWLLV